MAAVTAAIMPSPGPDVRDRGWAPDLKPEETLLDQQRRREDGKELGSSKIGDMAGGDAPTTLTAKTKPLVSKKVGFKPRPGERPIFPKKPNALGLLRLNGTRFGPGGRKIGLGQLKKPPGQNPLAGASERSSVVKNNPKPGSTIIGDRTLAFTLKEPSIDATVNERRTDDVPVTVPPVGSISGTDIQSSYEEPTVTPGSTKQPEIAMATQGNNSGIEREGTEQPVSLGHNGTTPTAGKKCNRIKVTHIRLPHSDNDGGQPTTSTHHSSSETGTPPSAETKKGDSSDALFQLLTDTFDNLNIKTFSVHLSKPSDLSQDAETVSRHILSGMKPLSYSSSSPSSSFLLPSLPVTSPSSAPSSSENLDLVKGDGPEVDTRKNGEMTTEPVSAATHQNERFPQEGNLRPFRRTPPKDGYPLRPRPNIRPLQKRTQQNFRPSRRLSPPLSMTAETEQHHSSDFSSPPPSSNSEEPLSVEAKTPERGSSSNREETSPMLFETEQNQSKREDVPTPHDMSHNVGSSKQPRSNTIIFQNKTSPNQWHHRDLSQPSSTELEKDPLTPNELQPSPSSSLTSSFISEESRTISGNVPDKESEGVMSPRFKQGKTKLLRGGIPPNRIPPNKYGFSKRTHANMRLFPNRTLFNLRPPQRPAQPLKLELGAEKEEPFSSREVPSSAPSSVFSGPVEHPVPDGGSDGDKFGTMSVTVDTGKNQTLRESAVPPFRRLPSKAGYPRRSYLNMGHLQNRTHPVLRPPQRPQRGPIRRFNPPTKLSREQNNIPKVQPNQSGENRVQSSDKKIQIDQSQDQDTGFEIHTGQSGGKDNTQTVQTNQLGEVHTNHGIEVNQLGEEEAIHNARITGSDSETDIYRERVDPDKPTMRRTPPVRQSSYGTANRSSRPTTVPGRKPAAAKKTAQGPTQMKKNITDTLKGQDSKMGHHDDGGQTSKTEVTGTVGLHMPKESNVSPSGDAGEPLGNVGVRNVTSGGFTVVWDAPEGKYKKFVVTKKKLGGKNKQPEGEGEVEDDSDKKDSDEKGDNEEGEDKETSKGKMVEHEGNIEENVVPESGVAPGVHRSTKAKPATESDKTLTKVLPGSARSFQFENLPPQTPFTVTLLGKGPGLLSRLHKLVISTGPEPPSDLVFSEITENSLTVSWTKPKSPVSGFKVTYTHTEEGEPVSVSVGSEDSTLDLSQLTPGSTYEISVLSVLGLDESDALQDVAMTPPDPPTDLRALNVTDTKALLLWRPALAAIDKYAIVYSSDKGSEVRITVSGNAAEQQLGDLQESTKYTVTITSQLGDLGSAPATTTFTTTRGSGGDGGGPQDLQASRVTPRTTLLSWKPPAATVGTYKLTYQAEGQEAKEVTVDGAVTEYSLARLHPGSKYTVQLQAETGGVHTTAISTDFTTGSLRFPFPTDCSQELLNGIKESGEAEVFPNGKQGSPLMVYCDMETDGGGWTVFQRRKDGSVDFFKGWKDYAKGFGDLSGEFWLGLENLHILTAMSRMGLRVDLRAGDEEVFAEYSTFEVAKRNFKLTVAGYSGTAGDSMTYHNNRLFSTKDRDPMPFITRCAMSYRGGWWYKNCHEANLNGLYGIDVKHQGIIWTSWKGQDFSIPFTEMKMRPSAFSPPALG